MTNEFETYFYPSVFVYVGMNVCRMCVGTWGGQERASHVLELELRVVVRHESCGKAGPLERQRTAEPSLQALISLSETPSLWLSHYMSSLLKVHSSYHWSVGGGEQG